VDERIRPIEIRVERCISFQPSGPYIFLFLRNKTLIAVGVLLKRGLICSAVALALYFKETF